MKYLSFVILLLIAIITPLMAENDKELKQTAEWFKKLNYSKINSGVRLPQFEKDNKDWFDKRYGIETFRNTEELLFDCQYFDYGKHGLYLDEELKYLKPLQKLKSLTIANCKFFKGKGLQYLKALPQLEKLYIFNTAINCKSLNNLKNCKSLKYLGVSNIEFSHNQLSDRCLWQISKIKTLNELKIYNDLNYYTTEGNKELMYLKKLPELELLFLNDLSDESIKYFPDMKNLNRLEIFGCYKFSNTGMKLLIKKLNNLKSLYLFAIKPDFDTGLLKSFKHIIELELDYITINDKFFKDICELKTLKKLVIETGILEDFFIIHNSWQYLPLLKELEYLDISNFLTEQGFHQLYKLNKLKFLAISTNVISNSIFDDIAKLINLEELRVKGYYLDSYYYELKKLLISNPKLKITNNENQILFKE